MELIQENDKILLLWDTSFDLQSSDFGADALKKKFNATIKFENVERLDLGRFSIFQRYFRIRFDRIVLFFVQDLMEAHHSH